MNNTNNHNDKITQLTSELIQQYVQGKLPPTQMHAIEKYLLENPFEAEAMEGISSNSNDFSKGVQTLQSNIQDRVKENSKKVIPIWKRYYGIAAAITLIVVGSIVIVNLFENNVVKEEQLALEDNLEVEEATPTLKEKAVEEPISIVKEETIEEDENVIIDDGNELVDEKSFVKPVQIKQVAEEIIIEEKDEKSTNEGAIEANDLAFDFEETIALAEDIDETEDIELADEEIVASMALELKEVAAPIMEKTNISKRSASKAAVAMARQKETEVVVSNSRKVSGTITSIEDGMPLPGVNVIIKGSTTGTISDFDGNYEITINEGDVLVYSFVGLVSEEIDGSGSSEINMAMSADAAQLSEIVVTGYAASSQNQELVPSKSARPKDGYSAYRKYLKDKLIYPQQALDSAIEGKVTVEFIVNTSGTLKDFKIKKGLGYGCDEEAIRLIKEGSSWEATEENGIPIEKKIQIKVKFELD